MRERLTLALVAGLTTFLVLSVLWVLSSFLGREAVFLITAVAVIVALLAWAWDSLTEGS